MSAKRGQRLSAANKKRQVRQAATVGACSTIESLESRTLMAAAPAVVAPSHVAVTPVTDDQLNVTWSDNSTNETQFVLDRAVGGGRFTTLATLPAGSTAYTDNGLVPSTLYRYRVRAANDAGFSKSASRGGTTAPWVINAAAQPDHVELSWEDHWSSETGFVVSRAVKGGKLKKLTTLPADATGYEDLGVTANSSYSYQIAPVTRGHKYKAGRAIATVPVQPLALPPAAPSGVLAQAKSDSRVDLSWVDNSSDELGFRVERSADGVNWAEVAVVAVDSTTYAAEGLSASTTYQFRVRAYNDVADSSYSAVAAATTQADATPVAPFAVTRLVLVNADTEQDVMDLTGGATIDFGVLGTQNLNVRAETSAGAESVRFTLNGADYRTESTAPYALGGDVNGTDYLAWTPAVGQLTIAATPYSLDAAAGDAGTGMTVVVTVVAGQPQPPPAAPSNLASTSATATSVGLAWSDNSDDEGGFKVERSTDGVNFTQVAAVGANVTSYTAAGLSPSTAYAFRVRAFNAGGDSAYSNPAAATTAAAPSGDTLGGYARPSAATTGVRDPSLLTVRTASLSTTSAGQVIENVDFAGGADLNILHDNVVVRNCRFSGTVSAGGEGAVRSGVVIQDCEFYGPGLFGLGRGISLYRCYVHGLRDGDFWRNPGDCTWEGNYFTDVYATSTTPHIDMIQWYWSNPAQRQSAANLVVRGNYWDVDNAYPLANQFNAILYNDMMMTDITWSYNWMKAGGYLIRTQNAARVTFTGNAFEGWGWGPMLTVGGYSNIDFNDNQILLNGALQPFEKPPGANSDLFTNT